MIRRTLAQTREATYAILLPSEGHAGMPVARGTGFFVTRTGYFVTARHVVDGANVANAWLMQSHSAGGFAPMLQWPELVNDWPEFDLALMKIDFGRNSTKAHLAGREDFPSIPPHLDRAEEGAPVYAFGYPLPVNQPVQQSPQISIGHVGLGHRTTSAIISSELEHTRMVQTDRDAQVYVLDKALNYGNSGGPIVLQDSGEVFAVCSRFQPVYVPQPNGSAVMIPSLCGIVSSLSNIADDVRALN